ERTPTGENWIGRLVVLRSPLADYTRFAHDRRTKCSLDRRYQTRRLLPQHVSFEPGVAIESQVPPGVEGHSAALLVQPLGGLAQPEPRLGGVPVPVVSQCQPQPVQNRPAGPAVGYEAALQQQNGVRGLAPPEL